MEQKNPFFRIMTMTMDDDDRCGAATGGTDVRLPFRFWIGGNEYEWLGLRVRANITVVLDGLVDS